MARKRESRGPHQGHALNAPLDSQRGGGSPKDDTSGDLDLRHGGTIYVSLILGASGWPRGESPGGAAVGALRCIYYNGDDSDDEDDDDDGDDPPIQVPMSTSII